MVFSSPIFLFIFLPSLLILYYFPLIKSKTWKNMVLLLFSIVFYAWGEPFFVFVMLAVIAANWAMVLRMEKSARHRKAWLNTALILDLTLLGVFKYLTFLTRNLAAWTGNDKLLLEIALPIGISFFTFQMMSYVYDVYYGNAKAQKNPIHVALYISLFPQLIAGPIVRYREVENEIVSRRETFEDFADGMRRFVYGFGKKVLLANFLAQVADNVFDFTEHPSVMTAWLGAVAYALQIYFDFSGYSDMAIGLGEMFGFHFLENFNFPYIAGSVTDFWRRWHISLSTWFRDYVYIPLGGNRVKKSRWVFNLFVVWLLTGIWHGANWTFLLWGLFYFVVLLLEKQTGFVKKLGRFSHVYTLVVVLLAWVIFRSPNIGFAVQYIGQMFGIGANGFIDGTFTETLKGTYMVFLCAVIAATPLFEKGFAPLRKKHILSVEWIWLVVVFAVSVFEVVSEGYNPFIYFNF